MVASSILHPVNQDAKTGVVGISRSRVTMIRKILGLLVLSLGFLSVVVDGQTTKGEIPFSGTATGQGTSGAADLTFKLWDAASGGNFLNYSDSQAGVPVAPDDSFSALLGAGTGGDVSSVIFAANPSVFISIQLTSMPDEIGPRVPLFSSGYAQNAASLGAPGVASVVRGNVTLEGSTATSGNILKGGALFIHNSGAANTFLGVNAGNLTMTGIFNTASGAFALNSNTTGSENTASGANALQSNTGGFNTANGSHALQFNTSGSNNAASGAYALNSNTTGSFNTASGSNALRFNTSGTNNAAVGYNALLTNTTGSYNAASGANALGSNTVGSGNTACGESALLSNTTGFENTASGASALRFNQFGVFNTANGVNALRHNTSSYNTASGHSALFSNTTGSDNTASGYAALYSNMSGGNTASGKLALFSNTTGYDNTAIGHAALYSNTTGVDNTAIGSGADVYGSNLFNATAIGAEAVVNTSNKIRLGNTQVAVIEGQVPYTWTSDRNQKENFRPVEGEEVLGKIQGLNVTSWNYLGHDPKQFRHYGPVAQDFFAAFGHDDIGTIGTPTTINSGDLDGILIAAAQALEHRTVLQRKEISALRKETDSLRAQNAELKARLDAVERLVSNHTANKPQ